MLSPLVLLLAAVAAPLLAIGAIRWRRGLLMALPLLVTLNGLSVPVGRSNLRLDQIAACLLAVPLVAPILTGERRLRTDSTVWWLVALLASNVVASALNSPVRTYSFLQCLNLSSTWAIYVLLINFLETREELEAFFHRCVWAALIASSIGIAAYVFAVAGFKVGGAEVSQRAAEFFAVGYGAYGTMYEPNIFGSYSAAHTVLAFVLLILAAQLPGTAGGVRLLRWLAALSAAGLVLSFTRAAWLGAVAGLGLFAIAEWKQLRRRLRLSNVLVPLGVALMAAVVVALVPGSAGELLRYKLYNLLNLASPTATFRLVTYSMALQQTLDHLFIGSGTFTFAALAAQGSDFQQYENWRNLWIGNYLVLALHDTGIVGLGLWLAMLASIMKRTVRAIDARTLTDQLMRRRTLALTAAVGSLLVSFLATSGFSLGYSWLLIGLLGAYCRVLEAERTATSLAPGSG